MCVEAGVEPPSAAPQPCSLGMWPGVRGSLTGASPQLCSSEPSQWRVALCPQGHWRLLLVALGQSMSLGAICVGEGFCCLVRNGRPRPVAFCLGSPQTTLHPAAPLVLAPRPACLLPARVQMWLLGASCAVSKAQSVFSGRGVSKRVLTSRGRESSYVHSLGHTQQRSMKSLHFGPLLFSTLICKIKVFGSGIFCAVQCMNTC